MKVPLTCGAGYIGSPAPGTGGLPSGGRAED